MVSRIGRQRRRTAFRVPYRGDFPLGLPGGTGAALKDAVAMTAARCVNYIEAIVTTSPGYKTTIDLPTVGARYGLRQIEEAVA